MQADGSPDTLNITGRAGRQGRMPSKICLPLTAVGTCLQLTIAAAGSQMPRMPMQHVPPPPTHTHTCRVCCLFFLLLCCQWCVRPHVVWCQHLQQLVKHSLGRGGDDIGEVQVLQGGGGGVESRLSCVLKTHDADLTVGYLIPASKQSERGVTSSRQLNGAAGHDQGFQAHARPPSSTQDSTGPPRSSQPLAHAGPSTRPKVTPKQPSNPLPEPGQAMSTTD